MVNAFDVIEKEQNLTDMALAQNKFRKTSLEAAQGKLQKICRQLQDVQLESCPFETKNCAPKDSARVRQIISEPYPSVFTFNVAWWPNVKPLESLLFWASIPQRFHLQTLYSTNADIDAKPKVSDGTADPSDPEYIMKSVVCFLGAHYMVYIKKKREDGTPVWRLYDDHNPIREFQGWSSVLEEVLAASVPTLLVYERVAEDNKNNDANDRVGATFLKQLESRAKSMQKLMDEIQDQEESANYKKDD